MKTSGFTCTPEKDVKHFAWYVLTGQRSIAWSEQQTACEHEWKKIGSSFEMGAQGEQGRAQNTQERKQKHPNCRKKETNTNVLSNCFVS